MIWALHGAVGESSDWMRFDSAVRQWPVSDGMTNAGVRKIDLWRFFESGGMSLREVGEAIAEEVADQDPDPVILGYSMGGRLAMHALVARPEMWKASIIVSAHPGLVDEVARVERCQKDAEWAELARGGDWQAFLKSWEAQSVLGSGGEMPSREGLASRKREIAQSYIDWSLGKQEHLTPRLRGVKCPILWVTGEMDQKFTTLAEATVPELADARHRVVPDCGHRVPWEREEDFASLCGEFLGGVLES